MYVFIYSVEIMIYDGYLDIFDLKLWLISAEFSRQLNMQIMCDFKLKFTVWSVKIKKVPHFRRIPTNILEFKLKVFFIKNDSYWITLIINDMQTKALFQFAHFYWINQNKCHKYGSFIDCNLPLKCKLMFLDSEEDFEEYCEVSLETIFRSLNYWSVLPYFNKIWAK